MFWNFLKKIYNNPAIIESESGKVITYKELNNDINDLLNCIESDSKRLAFIYCENNYKTIVSYLALLRIGHAAVMINSELNTELKQSLIDTYHPEFIFTGNLENIEGYGILAEIKGIVIYERKTPLYAPKIYKELALLLSTSGSTGSPKLVRLSYKNIQSNAESIAQYLSITKHERPITSLPLHYSYGLSVINSHILKGASIVLTKQNFVMYDFWKIFNLYKCTSFSGVPYSYQLLKKRNFENYELPTLKTLTQAGGKLNEELQKYFYNYARKSKINFFVMYGQTEATARISYVPYNTLGENIGSIGIPIPGGEIKVYANGKDITETGNVGELVYKGNNVMLGYADTRESLSKGDKLNGLLHTGDLGRKYKNGFFYIKGRIKRFVKIFGFRLNLDELEKMLENYTHCAVACFGQDDNLKIIIQTSDNDLIDFVREKIIKTLHLNQSVLQIRISRIIPLTSSGKRDYQRLNKLYP